MKSRVSKAVQAALKTPALFEYVITYLQEELNRNTYFGREGDESPDTIRRMVNDAIEAYEGGTR